MSKITQGLKENIDIEGKLKWFLISKIYFVNVLSISLKYLNLQKDYKFNIFTKYVTNLYDVCTIAFYVLLRESLLLLV